MRPPRIVILVLFFAACLFLLCRAITSPGRQPPVATLPAASTHKSALGSLFSFQAPFSLFPPNAVITIADDNSTSFAARPAAFGPPLPPKGLNGQLWIGSGFTEESLIDGGEGAGELGCSDVPGWEDGTNSVALMSSIKAAASRSSAAGPASARQRHKRDDGPRSPVVHRAAKAEPMSKLKNKNANDGTDDYLHEALQPSQKKRSRDAFGLSSPVHADIQSIQEGAEIAGKIVLLSRGGCGFLEKVKWAQRRGAVGLIVGDNQRGGPLIQMFARGDTSNVTIPSIFTSRTTAYLLSLMMQPGSFIEDILDENGKPVLQVQHSDKARKNKKPAGTTATPSPTSTPGATAPATNLAANSNGDTNAKSGSWIPRIFSWGSTSHSADSSRPPSSGQHDWVLVEDFSDEKDKIIKNSLEKASKQGTGRASSSKQAGDSFHIGVEDWRDPDLVGFSSRKDKSQGQAQAAAAQNYDPKNMKDPNGPKGGSITPGSGQYAADSPPRDAVFPQSKLETITTQTNGRGGLMSKIFGEDDGADFSQVGSHPAPIHTPIVEKPVPGHDGIPPPGAREGLWVVITPSSGASPFFDTLLVLVISPLITLTVVYALLILRARIRRRRWRAPKSVVERLPVRTYHTVASTPSQSPRVRSPSPPSPTTPLLQSQHGPSRPRPRSRTASSVLSVGNLVVVDSTDPTPKTPPNAEHEKRSSQWKKYMGRQVECVVCLEEYVDGVSQVMSLPCGHEFHVDCITPWLTTRRRTCPICKGDVVRSLARGSPSSPRYEPYRDDSEDDFLAQTASSSSDRVAGPDAARSDMNDSDDVEQGILSPAPRRPRRQGEPDGFLAMLSNSFRGGGGGGPSAARPPPPPRRSSGEQAPEEDRAR